jgi:glucose uptake protein GlcU
MLVTLVSAAAWLFTGGDHYWITAVFGYVFTIPMAVAAWTGRLSKARHRRSQPDTWQDWIGMFVIALLFSVLFVAIDKAVKFPGFSAIFTLIAIAMAFISLPCAFRAWLIEVLRTKQEGEPSDA